MKKQLTPTDIVLSPNFANNKLVVFKKLPRTPAASNDVLRSVGITCGPSIDRFFGGHAHYCNFNVGVTLSDM